MGRAFFLLVLLLVAFFVGLDVSESSFGERASFPLVDLECSSCMCEKERIKI